MQTDTGHASTLALMQQGRWDDAQARLEQSLADNPADARALRLLGTVLHLSQRSDQALAPLKAARRIDPDNVSTLINLGSVYLALDRVAEAGQCFARVVELDPASADGHFNLGLAVQRAGRLDDAEGHYQRALECDPDAPDAAANLAAVHMLQGQHERCVEESRRLLVRDPSHLQARLLLLRSLLTLGRLAEADRVLAQTPAPIAAHPELRALEGKLHATNGRLEHAARAYRAALASGDTRAQTARDLAHCLLEAGDAIAAVEVLRALIERQANIAEHHALLGLALHHADRFEAALVAYDEALQLQPRSAHYMAAKATILHELGRDRAAEENIEAAIAAAPAIVTPHLLRVERLIANGEIGDALLACERYLRNAGAECNMIAARAFLLHALGRAHEAAALMDFDGLIAASVIAAPAGYADLASFNDALSEHILAHPSLSTHNAARKATQHGRQSGNLLFGDRGPFDAFESVLWQSARRYVQELVRDPGHPFRARPPALDAVYAWAVVLERSGFQTPHIHPSAWLSGVYYPRVPAIVDQPDTEQGWIEFGSPPPELTLSPAAPTRRIKPQEGLLLLFPAYFYHRTLPFDSDESRISIAFDFSPRARAA